MADCENQTIFIIFSVFVQFNSFLVFSHVSNWITDRFIDFLVRFNFLNIAITQSILSSGKEFLKITDHMTIDETKKCRVVKLINSQISCGVACLLISSIFFIVFVILGNDLPWSLL